MQSSIIFFRFGLFVFTYSEKRYRDKGLGKKTKNALLFSRFLLRVEQFDVKKKKHASEDLASCINIRIFLYIIYVCERNNICTLVK